MHRSEFKTSEHDPTLPHRSLRFSFLMSLRRIERAASLTMRASFSEVLVLDVPECP